MTEPTAVSGLRRPVLAFDGTESIEGRALFVISALHWCAEWLHRVDLRFIDIANEDVDLALRLFAWEHGVSVEARSAHSDEFPLGGADLYAASVFRTPRHLRLSEARHAGIPTLVAIQFPSPQFFSAAVLFRQRAAFDPRAFAEDLERIVSPWL